MTNVIAYSEVQRMQRAVRRRMLAWRVRRALGRLARKLGGRS